MAVPVTPISILRLLLQCEQNLNGLQRDMRANAQMWLAAATAQTVDVPTLTGYMTTAAVEYNKRLDWVSTLQTDTATWNAVKAMWTLLGGTAQDFANLTSPLRTVANQLGPADKSSFAAIITVCNQIISAINAPLSLWPE